MGKSGVVHESATNEEYRRGESLRPSRLQLQIRATGYKSPEFFLLCNQMRCKIPERAIWYNNPNLLRIVGRRGSMPWIDIEKTMAEDETTEREKRQVIDFARRKAKP